MNISVLMLGSYMILMGILGFINSGSPTAFIMSGMGLIAVLLSYFSSKSSIIMVVDDHMGCIKYGNDRLNGL